MRIISSYDTDSERLLITGTSDARRIPNQGVEATLISLSLVRHMRSLASPEDIIASHIQAEVALFNCVLYNVTA